MLLGRCCYLRHRLYAEKGSKRAFQLGEFSGAVVPENAPQHVFDILDKNGVEYRTYNPSMPGDRQRVIQEFHGEQDVLFQRGQVGMTNYGAGDAVNALMAKGMEEFNAGNAHGLDLIQWGLQQGIDYVKKIVGDLAEGVNILPTFGRFKGDDEPTFYFTVENLPDEKLPAFMYGVSRVADEKFTQRAIIVSRRVSENTPYGPIEVNGIKGYVEPTLVIKFDNPLTSEQLNRISEIARDLEYDGFTMTPDDKGIEIMRVERYNKEYEPARFEGNFRELSRRLDAEGIHGLPEQSPREVWLVDQGAPSSGQRESTTYTGLAEHIRHIAGRAAEEIDRRIADNPYNPTIPEEYKNLISNKPESDTPRRIDAPEFKAWFKDSKAVDENGNPLTLYHGTQEVVDRFDVRRGGDRTNAPSAKEAIFFTNDASTAGDYSTMYGGRETTALQKETERLEKIAQRTGREKDWNAYYDAYSKYEEAELSGDYENSGANIVPVYLSMQNPLIHDFQGADYRETSYYELIKQAKENGNDGVILKNTYDPADKNNRKLLDVYAVFDPTLIKSTFNRGTWDANDPRILYQKGKGNVPEQPSFDFDAAINKRNMAKGAMWLERGKAVIAALENADVSTALHEPAHAWITTTMIPEDRGVVTTWLRDTNGMKDLPDDWMLDTDLPKYRDAHETFSRAFERYMREAELPLGAPEALRGVFDKIKTWLTDIYKQIKGSQIDVKMSPELVAMFEKNVLGEAPEKRTSVLDRVPEPPMRKARQASMFGEIPQEGGLFQAKELGPVFEEYHHDWRGAVDRLTKEQTGDARGALYHPEVGDIDLIWGYAGKNKGTSYGLAKLIKWHSEVLGDLQGIINNMEVVERTPGSITLKSNDYHRAVIKLDWYGEEKRWLLTAYYDAKSAAAAGRTIDIPSSMDEMTPSSSSDINSITSGNNEVNNPKKLFQEAENPAQPDNMPEVVKAQTGRMSQFTEQEAIRQGTMFDMRQEFGKKKTGTGTPQEGGLFQEAGRTPMDTPEFKTWFGESKVVDDSGNPLVVYHGESAEMEVFGRVLS